MITEKYKPDSSIDETREVSVHVPGVGTQVTTAAVIDGMAVVEGDIVVGAVDEVATDDGDDGTETRAMAISVADDDALWPEGVVPYEIDSSITNTSKVEDAIDHWENNTPVRFTQRNGENDYVEFFNGDGCWSRVGRQGGRQRVSLDSGCGTGAAIHEIGHAVGVWHEQSRSDRDTFVTVNWGNIEDGEDHNFEKREGANDVGRYDYGSIMHYGPRYFSNGGKTIEAPEPIGNRSGLSDGDIDEAFRLYAPTDAETAGGITDDWRTVEFDDDVGSDPAVLAAVQTFNGGNPVAVRMRDAGSGSAELFLEEEQSGDSETGHVGERVGVFAAAGGRLLDETASAVGEAGTLRTGQGEGGWETVRLQGRYSDPVVVMQLQSYNGPDPAHLRVRDVGGSSFRFRIEEWDYLDGGHTDEEVGYVVLESGRHRLRDGTELEVGTVDTDHGWAAVGTSLDGQPSVFSQCQTTNGNQAVVTRHRNASPSGFEVRLQEEEGNNGPHRTETVGYVAVGRPEQFEFGIAGGSVTDDWQQLDYESDFQSVPATVASIQTFNGGDPADVRLRNPSASDVEMRIEEERSNWDLEREHTSEAVSYVATPPGRVHHAPGKELGEAGVVSRNQSSGSEWHRVGIDGQYADPVVLAQLLTRNGNQPAHIRLRDVGGGSFRLQVEEWDYIIAQAHAPEEIGYLVLESGVYSLPDGVMVEVGTVRTNHSWTEVSLDGRLAAGEDVAVVSRCQTYNGPEAVVTRQRNASPGGFDVRLQEEEGNNGPHRTETVGYLAAVRNA